MSAFEEWWDRGGGVIRLGDGNKEVARAAWDAAQAEMAERIVRESALHDAADEFLSGRTEA